MATKNARRTVNRRTSVPPTSARFGGWGGGSAVVIETDLVELRPQAAGAFIQFTEDVLLEGDEGIELFLVGFDLLADIAEGIVKSAGFCGFFVFCHDEISGVHPDSRVKFHAPGIWEKGRIPVYLIAKRWKGWGERSGGILI